jgi:hypothetical protein
MSSLRTSDVARRSDGGLTSSRLITIWELVIGGAHGVRHRPPARTGRRATIDPARRPLPGAHAEASPLDPGGTSLLPELYRVNETRTNRPQPPGLTSRPRERQPGTDHDNRTECITGKRETQATEP